MRAASATALDNAKKRLVKDFASYDDVADIRAIGDQFLGISDTLDATPKLAEALTSTIRSTEDKHQLIHHIFRDVTIHPVVSDIVSELSGQTWSQAADLANACEELGLFTIIYTAQTHHRLEQIQQELFTVDHVLRDHRDLRGALIGKSRSVEERVHLAESVFEHAVSPETMLLLQRVIQRTPSGRIITAVRQLRMLTAQAQGKELAVVQTAVPLSDTQKQRLREILQRKTGTPVHIDSEVNPSLIGGMRIRQGAQLFEGTLEASLREVKAALAG